MPGMGQPGMSGMGIPSRLGSAQNPVGGPPGIVSAKETFGDVGTLPSPDLALMPRRTATPNENGCKSCGTSLRPNTKFCTKCGTRV
jgi:hypothetical protein